MRRPDPRIAKIIHHALGSAKTVLDIGAGAGSYEPEDRYVLAMEPSAVMRAQRPEGSVPALIGAADAIPFDDGAFDAAMAVLTVHHWKERAKCLRELRRVTRGPIVIMTFDPDAPTEFWMGDYAPELVEVERRRYGDIASITEALVELAKSPRSPCPGTVRTDSRSRFTPDLRPSFKRRLGNPSRPGVSSLRIPRKGSSRRSRMISLPESGIGSTALYASVPRSIASFG